MGKLWRFAKRLAVMAFRHHPQSLRARDDTYNNLIGLGRKKTRVELTLGKGDESPAKIILLYMDS